MANKAITRIQLPLAALGLLLAVAAGPGAAQTFSDDEAAKSYAHCMELARSRPEEAFDKATAWQSLEGSTAARHCAAAALLNLGHYTQAAIRLETLADDLTAPDAGLRVDLLAQAGQAWLLAGETTRAHAVQSAALKLAPDNAELWVDRAVTLASANNYWEAIDDLNEAENRAPNRAEILIFRASAYRFVEANDLAMEDVERGLQLAPDNLEGLLERGILRRLAGDEAGAREDWLRVVTLAEGSPAAEAARANLAALDVKLE